MDCSATGQGEGANQAREAVKALLENPLLDGGDVLAKAEGVLVSILGGPDLTLADVQKTVEPISRLASRAHVIMGAAIDESFRGRLSVTVIATANVLPRRPVQPVAPRPAAAPRPGEPGSSATPKRPLPPCRMRRGTGGVRQSLPLEEGSRESQAGNTAAGRHQPRPVRQERADVV